MTFDEMVQQVIIDTNRPDMTYTTAGGSGEIPQAVQFATHLMHTKQGRYFPQDFRESEITFDTPAYFQTLDVSTAFTLFRGLNYIRKLGTGDLMQSNPLLPPLPGYYRATSREAVFLRIVDAVQFFDEIYGLENQDICWRAGDTVNLKSSTNMSKVKVGWFTFPDISIATYNSWIARDYPFAIIYAAESKIFTSIGQQDNSRKMDGPGGLCVTSESALLNSALMQEAF